MKLKLLFIIFLITPFLINSQTSCGTTAPQNYQLFKNGPSKQQASNNIFCIDIAFHIVREEDGSGGFNASNTGNIIQILNEDYNQYGIFFNETGVDFISNDNFHDLVYEEDDRSILDALFNENNNPNAIDFYLVGSLERIDNDGRIRVLAGVASDVLSSDLIVRNSSALTNTSTHEIGHAFNLLHTHEDKYGIENIERPPDSNANCRDKGDKLCDTPADPNLFGIIGTDCLYPRNDGFDPPVHNYMSYSRKSCKNEFLLVR